MDATAWAVAIAFWIACGVGCVAIGRDRGAPSGGLGLFAAGMLLGPIGVALTIWQTRDVAPDPRDPGGTLTEAPTSPTRLVVRFCPQCGIERAGVLRFCRGSGLDLGDA